jgi:hypothetical protein
MSEYQRYEFMAIDRPLTPQQLEEVNDLSSHIEASSTHAFIEYNWGDFKYDPIEVLHDYFDGFLYWANWGSPRLALRFPHGILPSDLLASYGLEDYFVMFTQHEDYDILDIHFYEMEALDEWVDYELGPLMPIRDELMAGDLRALYIIWLAVQDWLGGYEDEEVSRGKKDEAVSEPEVPPGLGTLTAAQEALAELFRVSSDLTAAAARYSSPIVPTPDDDIVAWVELLPQQRRNEYLVRLARNEPGLSRLLLKELRELGRGKAEAPPQGKHVPYITLLAESKAIHARLARERLEQERQARQRHLQSVIDQQETYWKRIDEAVSRKNSAGYDEAHRLLLDLRDASNHFHMGPQFQDRFRAWVRAYITRPAFIRRLRESKFDF